MVYNPDIHHRRSIRLKNYDYSHCGAYFITICSWQRELLFGNVVNEVMVLNDIGRIVVDEWNKIPVLRADTTLDVSVIMPNHFHGILHIREPVGAKQASSALPAFDGDSGYGVVATKGKAGETFALPLHGSVPGSLNAIIQNYKSVSTRKINQIRANPGCPVWQKNYYERIIRNEHELSRAREYIVNNPLQWELDKENPARPS